jgi:hypothetical protein
MVVVVVVLVAGGTYSTASCTLSSPPPPQEHKIVSHSKFTVDVLLLPLSSQSRDLPNTLSKSSCLKSHCVSSPISGFAEPAQRCVSPDSAPLFMCPWLPRLRSEGIRFRLSTTSLGVLTFVLNKRCSGHSSRRKITRLGRRIRQMPPGTTIEAVQKCLAPKSVSSGMPPCRVRIFAIQRLTSELEWSQQRP